MECDKCKTPVKEGSRFCGQCGKNLQEKQYDFPEGIKTCSQLWYIIGFFRGTCLAQGDLASLKEFEAILDKNKTMPLYLEIIESVENKINMLNKNDN